MGLVLSLAGCAGQGDAESSSSSGSGAAVQTQDDVRASFPSFSGGDLEGNAVDSESLFSGNKVTVVTFWFSDCPACIDELSSFEALNSELAEKGGRASGYQHLHARWFEGQHRSRKTDPRRKWRHLSECPL
ncbi:MAG: peroxiredoxin family protein [Eggerthellaceae bacterium]